MFYCWFVSYLLFSVLCGVLYIFSSSLSLYFIHEKFCLVLEKNLKRGLSLSKAKPYQSQTLQRVQKAITIYIPSIRVLTLYRKGVAFSLITLCSERCRVSCFGKFFDEPFVSCGELYGETKKKKNQKKVVGLLPLSQILRMKLLYMAHLSP